MRFEYQTIRFATGGFLGGKFEEKDLDEQLNALGREGWEIAAAFDTNKTQGETRDIVVIFKRRV